MIPVNIAASVRHRPSCAGADLEAAPIPGSARLVLQCRACGGNTRLSTKWTALVREALGMAAPTTPVAQLEEGTEVHVDPAAEVPVDLRITTWYCRVHADQRVSWHGRDCPVCRDAHRTRQAIARREARERATARANKTA